jgi:hypothetical protein
MRSRVFRRIALAVLPAVAGAHPGAPLLLEAAWRLDRTWARHG